MKNSTIIRLANHAKTISSAIISECVKGEGELSLINELGNKVLRTPFEGIRIIIRENKSIWNGCDFGENELRNIKKTTQQLNFVANEVLNRVRRAVPNIREVKPVLDGELIRMV